MGYGYFSLVVGASIIASTREIGSAGELVRRRISTDAGTYQGACGLNSQNGMGDSAAGSRRSARGDPVRPITRMALRPMVVALALATVFGAAIGGLARPGPATVTTEKQALAHHMPSLAPTARWGSGESPTSAASGPVFDESFTESGLATGSSWNVSLGGHTQTASAGEPITFTEPAGAYPYTLAGPPGFQPTGGAAAFTGTLQVPGSSNAVIPPGIGVWSEPFAVAYDPANGYLYVANDGSSSVSVINGSTDSLVVPQIAVGSEPIALAYDPSNGDLYVAGIGNNFLTIVDTTTNEVVVPELPVGAGPDGVAYDASDGDIYVANSGTNNVSVVDGTTNAVIVPGIPAGDDPNSVAFDVANGYVYVTNTESNNVTVIDGSTNSVVGPGIPVGTEPYAITFDPSNGFLYTADYGAHALTVINGSTDVVELPSLAVGAFPAEIAYDTSNGFLYVTNTQVNSVSVVDGWTDTLVAENIAVGDLPTGVTVDPVNGYVYVTCAYSDNVTVIDGNGGLATAWEPDPTYSVSFSESGLSSGATWSVSLAGSTRDSPAGIPITFDEPNGTYLYSVSSAGSPSAVPAAGNATVAGSPISVPIAFNASPAPSNSGFLGLPGDSGYVVVAAILAAGAVAGAVGYMAGQGRAGRRSSTPPPPGAAP
jgi:YVTN family beta-propeller protein